jgi:RNA polymerase sigma-70 factor (sigma-E family)
VRTTQRDAEFTDFVTARRPTLLRAARLLAIGDEAFAEDLVQTTLTKAYLAWPKVRLADDPVRYAHRILTNSFIDETRRARRGRERLCADPGGPDGPPVRLPEVADATGELSDRDEVLAALAQLAPQQRAVVVLRHWLDLDVETTARSLGISAGAVKSANSRALALLRTSLTELSDEVTTRSAS